MRTTTLLPRALVVSSLFLGVLRGDEWPQWMGPRRDNVWREEGILERFPDGGPKVVWRVPVDGGYSGPAVAGGRVYVTDYVTSDDVQVPNFERKSFTGVERVHALDAKDGSRVWSHEYPVNYEISYPSGPRCTPVVHEGKVYTLGAEGHLFAFDAATGDVAWSKDLKVEYGTKAALWGYAAHPLVDGRKLICVVGGEGSHTVAFDKDTGKELWRTITAKEQGYSPPTIIEAGGTRQLIVVRPDGVSGVDPDTGKEHWSVPYEATNGSIIMSPIVWKNHLFVGGFSNKNLLLKLAKDRPAAEVVWRDLDRKGMSPVNVQPILAGDVLYGFDQRGSMYGVSFPSGDRLWETAQPVSERAVQTGTAFIVRQGARYFLFSETGELVIAKLEPEGYAEVDRTTILAPTNVAFGRRVVWSAPAYAGRRGYFRNDQECVCVDLSAN